jgi:hypothetical protein
MSTIVYCCVAADADSAAVDANQKLPTAGWRAADGDLPNGDPAGTACDKDPAKTHWLITDDPVGSLDVEVVS